jgi:hypothetical protein
MFFYHHTGPVVFDVVVDVGDMGVVQVLHNVSFLSEATDKLRVAREFIAQPLDGEVPSTGIPGQKYVRHTADANLAVNQISVNMIARPQHKRTILLAG